MCNSLRPITIKLLWLSNLASVDNVVETAFYDTLEPMPKTAIVVESSVKGEKRGNIFSFLFFHLNDNELSFSI